MITKTPAEGAPKQRKRREDIPLFVEHFLNHFCQRHRRPIKQIADDAMHVLTAASWPGNVRQLRNVMERLVVTVMDDVIAAKNLPSDLYPAASSDSEVALRTLVEVTEEAAKVAIGAALAASHYHREQTAKSLGISAGTLHYKMSRYGLH